MKVWIEPDTRVAPDGWDKITVYNILTAEGDSVRPHDAVPFSGAMEAREWAKSHHHQVMDIARPKRG